MTQVVFLYRFLSENLQYISSMLAMRLQPEGGGAQLAQQQDGTQQAQQEREETQQAQQMPFLLLLDVHMDAPVISMPRTTNRCCLRCCWKKGRSAYVVWLCSARVLHSPPASP